MAASTPPRDASQLTELALLSEHYWTDRRALLPVLGAYLPRFGDGSPLSALPKEVLQHIARLAYRPRLKPKFEIPGDNVLLREYVEKFGREPTINLHDEHYLLNGGHKQCHRTASISEEARIRLPGGFPHRAQLLPVVRYETRDRGLGAGVHGI